jgi:ankyrin repeat protein
VTSNLLVIERQYNLDVLQFTHLSVKEYLIVTRIADYSVFEAHLAVANSCLTYIDISLGPDYPPTSTTLNTMTFPEYAIWFWCFHCAMIGEEGRGHRELATKLAKLMRLAPVSENFANFTRIRHAWFGTPWWNKDEIVHAISEVPSPFFIACIWGYAEVVDDALSDMVHARTIWGHTALHIAAFYDRERILRQLLSAGADVNARDDAQRTPLFTAVYQNNVGIVRCLLEIKQLDVNVSAYEGMTPLIDAASEGRVEIVQALLQHEQTDVNARMSEGWTALTKAMVRGHTEVVLQMVHSGKELDINTQSHDRTPLTLALQGDILDIAYILIAQPSIDVNRKDRDGSTPLIIAAKHNHCDFVRYLLQNCKGLEISAQVKEGGTAFGWAVQSRNTNTVRVLVSCPEVDVNITTVYHQPLLHAAFDSVQRGVVCMLLERLDLNINALNKSNESAIFVAIRRREPDFAKLILESRAGLDPNLKYDITSYSRSKRDKSVRNLSEAEQRRLHGRTILHLGARLGYIEVLRLLIDKFKDTVNVHARIAQGDTALHCAVSGTSLEALQILLDETEIDIDATNEDGMTVLHLAAESGNPDAVLLLLDHGADMDIAANGGSTAEQLAARNGHDEVAELLRSIRRKQDMSLGEAESLDLAVGSDEIVGVLYPQTAEKYAQAKAPGPQPLPTRRRLLVPPLDASRSPPLPSPTQNGARAQPGIRRTRKQGVRTRATSN